MKTIRFAVIALVLSVIAFGSATQSQAASSSVTLILTQAEINTALSTALSYGQGYSDVSVLIQPNVLTIYAGISIPNKGGIDTASAWSPVVANGSVTWTLLSASANGQSATQDELNKINSEKSALRTALTNLAAEYGYSTTYHITKVVLKQGVALVTVTHK